MPAKAAPDFATLLCRSRRRRRLPGAMTCWGAERRLFRWLGAFVGGATPDALEAVTSTGNDVLLAGLTALVDASLLQTDVARARCYTQLVTLRAFAEEHLRTDGE